MTETAAKHPIEIKEYYGRRRRGRLPAKSKQQWRKMQLLYRQGKISKAELDRFVKGVDYEALPERVGKKRKPRKTARRGKRRR